MRTHRPPATCPVCAGALILLRLGCPSCGTEVSGHFETCRFCRLDAAEAATLEVFLRGRGNVRDVQTHLDVSYPTARTRVTEVLQRLGMATSPRAPAGPGAPAEPGAPAGPGARIDEGSDVEAVLKDLATGRIDVAQAESLLRSAAPPAWGTAP